MPKVTILVAAYNASAYLRCCLDSLLSQTLDDFQAICIDDASTDDTLSILREYHTRDHRIEVIHLSQNQGQAHARNIGLAQARGSYICMLDADDWFSPNALQEAVDAFNSQEDIDSVLFEVSLDDGDHAETYAMPQFQTLTGKVAFRLSLTWQIHGLYMVRANIHMQYPYDETCLLYSDDNTTRLHFLASRRVARCSGVYHYRQHAASSTHAVTVRRFDYLRANESMLKTLQKLHVSSDILIQYENHRWLNIIDVYMLYHVHGKSLSAEDRRYGIRQLHQAWKSIHRELLTKKAICKLGYYPMPTWCLFRFEDWIYFTLRGLLGKNR